jgi:hypothetical protein
VNRTQNTRHGWRLSWSSPSPFFNIERSRKIELKVYEISASGDQAQAKGRRYDSVVLNNGQRIKTETGFTFRLKRSSNGWVIEETKFS